MRCLLLLVLVGLCGCARLEHGLLDRQETVTPVVREETTARYEVVKREDGSSVTNVAGWTVTTVTNYVTNVVYTPKAAVTRSLETIQAVNSVANPTPTAPLVNVAVTLLGLVYGAFAHWKSRNYRAVAETVVRGVEATGAADVKKMVKELSRREGTSAAVSAVVDRVTRRRFL